MPSQQSLVSMPDMAEKEIFGRIAKFYDERVDRYGNDPRACDYGRAESQLSKFKVLSEVGDLTGKHVLDVGCGFADYAVYLGKRFKRVKYMGIDISQRMIDEAKRLRPDLELRVLNILDDSFNEPFDVVTSNGIYYLLGEKGPELMRRIIRRMYALARNAVAFNSLSSYAPRKEPNEFYPDPLETFQFSREITPWVTLRHDYLPHDFTIYMYHEQPRL